MEIISKEEAKRRIDEAPGDFVIWSAFNTVTLLHESSCRVRKSKGKRLLDRAIEIRCGDDEIMGILTFVKYREQDITNSILFPKTIG